MIELFKGKETEHNWQKREANLKWFKEKFLDPEGFDYEEVVEQNAKYFVDAMLQSSLSLRTSLCLSGLTVMVNFIKAYSTRIIDSVAEQIFNGLVKASYQSKKMISLEISNAFHTLFEKTSHGARLIPQISALIDDKNVNLRENCIQILTIILQRTKKEQLEKLGQLQLVEKCLDKGLTDAQPHIREQHRDLFFIYQNIWPNKAKR
jgi:CLIP-associating protein 1/2